MREDVVLGLDLDKTHVYERMGGSSGIFVARMSVKQAKALRKQIEWEIKHAEEHEPTSEERFRMLEDADTDELEGGMR